MAQRRRLITCCGRRKTCSRGFVAPGSILDLPAVLITLRVRQFAPMLTALTGCGGWSFSSWVRRRYVVTDFEHNDVRVPVVAIVGFMALAGQSLRR